MATTDDIAQQIAAERAADAADRGLADALLAGLRIGHAGTECQAGQARKGRDTDGLAVHHKLPRKVFHRADASLRLIRLFGFAAEWFPNLNVTSFNFRERPARLRVWLQVRKHVTPRARTI
ncbi:hypothetical protein [Porphyrobacter sp. CCH7-A1]|uniref:hypothetical protein n=1 Tax=Porphyrobacter sp. CCH7-A1 TaxID=1768773 RepID=UPI000A8B8946|nr:hypothetical protein [Porphyrobacter sp. CCH7-A1]